MGRSAFAWWPRPCSSSSSGAQSRAPRRIYPVSGSALPSPGRRLRPRRARADLDLLVDRLEAIHPEPWHGISREDFVAEVEALQAELPD